MKEKPLKRFGLTAIVLVLIFGLFAFALESKLGQYRPQDDLTRCLSSAAKMKGERHDKIVTDLATDCVGQIAEDKAPTADTPLSSDCALHQSSHIFPLCQFRSPPLASLA